MFSIEALEIRNSIAYDKVKNKRKYQKVDKDFQILNIYYEKQLKPKDISKQLNVDIKIVYKAIANFKSLLKKMKNGEEFSLLPGVKPKFPNNYELLTEIEDYLERYHFFKLDIKFLQTYLKTKFSEIPSETTLR